MAAKVQLVILALLVCVIITGCKSVQPAPAAAGTEGLEVIPPEREKARLLGQLDRKFENPNAHYRLGRLYQADGLWSQAEHEYNIALSFDPIHRQAQAGKVKILLESADTAKAKLLAEIYMNQASASAGASLRLAMAFQEHALDEYALKCYQKALKLAPDSAKVHRQVGYYYLSKNNKEKAKEYLSRSFQLDPMQAEVAGQLGRLGVVVKVPRTAQTPEKKSDMMAEQPAKKKNP